MLMMLARWGLDEPADARDAELDAPGTWAADARDARDAGLDVPGTWAADARDAPPAWLDEPADARDACS